MIDINPGTLTVPTGLPGIPPIKLDIGGILEVESRIQEIAFVTPVKAPELMAVFNVAYSDLSNMIAQVKYQFEIAKVQEEKARAICIIDRVPGILKEKGLTSAKSPSGSEDLRSAILALDPDYSAAQEKTIQIKCALVYRHSPDLSVEPGQVSSFFKK